MQARAHLLQHDLSSKDFKTKQNKKKVTYSQWISRVRIYTNQDRPSRGHKSGTFKPCFVWIVLSEHKLHFYFLILRVNTVNPCLEGRSRHSVWHTLLSAYFPVYTFPWEPMAEMWGQNVWKHAEEGKEEGSALKIQKKKKKKKRANNFNFMNLFEFSHASDNNATHGTRTLQEHWALCSISW